MNAHEQTELGGEPDALRAILFPGGPDAVALEAMHRAKTTTPEQLREALAKRQATVTARAALIGAIVTPSHDDRGRPTWLLSRWSLTREFASLDDLEALLDRMGAPG